MRIARLALSGIFVLFMAAGGWGEQQQSRDLKYEKENSKPETPAPQPAKVSIPRSYAVVIGIANYAKLPDSAQLKFSERDAEAIYSILISPEGGNFKAENVRKLIGPKATLANIRQELEQWLPSITKDDDRVLIYFAGHGFVYGGKGYLAPYDFDKSDIAGTGYSMEKLGRVIGSSIKGKWKVLLTDSCHSGAITPEADVQTLNRGLLDLNKSLFSLTASRDRERSFESPEWGGGHGIFTYYVVKGLEGTADESGDGIVTADELANYVRTQVRQATAGKQNPTSERGSFDPDMLLAYVPSGVRPGAPPAPKFGTLIFESNMDGVEVFIDGKSAGVVNKGKPLRLPGLAPGAHTIKGVRMGYEPDGPREETVYPGQESTVSLKIVIPRRRSKAALDRFEEGLEFYNKGSIENYKRAAERFRAALAADPDYSQAALYLARALRDSFEFQESRKAFEQAITIDPDYLEARATYGGMLLDMGDEDEAIRQLNTVVTRNPEHALAQYLLAQALARKELFAQSIEAARKAIALTPNNAEAYFWLGESLRMTSKYSEAVRAYSDYLRLSDFDSKLAGKMNYYVLGFLVGAGRKKRAAQRDVWKELRGLAYFGICDSERKLGNFDAAIENCRTSLSLDSSDPYAHYALGLSYLAKGKNDGAVEMLPAARTQFRKMLDLNPELVEAQYARKNIAAIDDFLAGR
ncbi:MAG: tetratricopeptide repeat protein [Bryobacterales bacterium]|nr:tetratricopeptide repeat protein [Bryobacterales bacterium]